MEPQVINQNLTDLAVKMKRVGLPKSLLSKVGHQIEINPYGLFYLPYETEINYRKVRTSLSFFRPAGADNYDLTSITVKLKPHRFNILDKNCFDLSEGPPVSRWLYLDPARKYQGAAKLDFHLSYLDVGKALMELPFGKYLKKREQTRIITDLQQGDLVPWDGRSKSHPVHIYLQVNVGEECIDTVDQEREPISRHIRETLRPSEMAEE